VVPSWAAEINIAAASNVQFAFDDLVKEFHASQTGIKVKITYGSSGNFYAQLQNQAPFDLFFSADMDYPRKLADDGLALDKDVFFYAAGRIVVWVLNSSPVDLDKLGIRALLAPSVKRIAIANPAHAPYGVAAVAAMKSLHVYKAAEPKLVYGDNIAQTAQFVQTGSADIGIIALSMAVAPQLSEAGHYWEVPVDVYPPVEQGGIILNRTREAQAASAFRDFVLGDHGREVLARYRYVLPKK
jgi:molybdate transport system substrate-binding protein